MKQLLFTLLAMAMLGRCAETTVRSAAETGSPDPLTIRTGTSFGMCVGYCFNDYVLNGTSVTLTQNGNRTQQVPTKSCQATITPDEWNALKALASFDAFSQQPERIGCPDCADGGAEYIELETGGRKHRVTFEYNQTIPGFEPLVDALRSRREAFKECQ
ncbi:hypothetical protein [Spirosoma rigui]|uniref:hypothetical protein n=1 Tax=Spirosoma rigui TaxID=564064 RepID=UPI0009B0EDE5|nr:hypothetical protein [Spirosoma rigui]